MLNIAFNATFTIQNFKKFEGLLSNKFVYALYVHTSASSSV